jgi:hypothetical protein
MTMPDIMTRTYEDAGRTGRPEEKVRTVAHRDELRRLAPLLRNLLNEFDQNP